MVSKRNCSRRSMKLSSNSGEFTVLSYILCFKFYSLFQVIFSTEILDEIEMSVKKKEGIIECVS